MPIYFPPPPPFMGGSQPLTGHELNPQAEAVPETNPPFSHLGRVASIAAIVLASQPPAPSPFIGSCEPLQQRQLPAAILTVSADNPPLTHQGRNGLTFSIVLQSQPSAPNPFLGGKQPLAPPLLNPSITAVREDNPPFSIGLRGIPEFMDLRQAWEPAPPTAWQGLRVVPIPSVSIDNPPFSMRRPWPELASWQIPLPPLPYRPTYLIPDNVDNPRFGQRRIGNEYAAWRLPDPSPQLQRLLAQPLVTTADNPPDTRTAVIAAIAQAWQPAASLPILRRVLNPSVLAVREDNPPFGVPARRTALAVIRSWIAGIPPEVKRQRLTASGLATTSLIIASASAYGDGVNLSGYAGETVTARGDGVTMGGYAGETVSATSDDTSESGGRA